MGPTPLPLPHEHGNQTRSSRGGAFRLRYGPAFADRIAGIFANGTSLNNGGERLTLEDAATNALIDFSYQDSYPWPESPDGQGATLVLEGSRDPVDPAHWRASLLPGGTPGEVLSFWDEWRRLHFTEAEQLDPAVSGEQADPDGDGIGNLLESAFGIDPRQPNPAGGRLVARIDQVQTGGLTEAFLTLRFPRPAARSIEVTVEVSTDMITWEPGETYLLWTLVERDPSDLWETVECRTLAPINVVEPLQAYWRLLVRTRAGLVGGASSL